MSTEQQLAFFWDSVKVAFKNAHQILTGRVASRDTGMTPWDKMAFKEQSFVTMIFHKAARLVSMVQADPTDKELYAKIDDELLDIMNYAAMHYAYRRMKEGVDASVFATKG